MISQTSSTLAQFATAMRDPMLMASPEYTQLFWRPYLGASAFSLWCVMVSAQALVRQGVYERWPTVNVLAQMAGEGDRYTILGRAATKTRPAQVGTLDLLVEENMVIGWMHGEGRGRRYTFEVKDTLPLLTPRQARRLDTAVAKAHRRYLDKVGMLDSWQRLLHKTLVQPPGAV